ncbi:hypothetical protein [Actinocorallia sp. A-T 12471]|uniref:hypothetical protein n=1 Tax=Actinocorallia sp. A-T 12471 TaxID=3089813 RepID=UPI0029CDAFC6|nr:hypothetical protein [Actinocorallia sp. A-T 12471]MDX6741942.1 hypothetical protein [Actinocorallia sp. A-T 12471]
MIGDLAEAGRILAETDWSGLEVLFSSEQGCPPVPVLLKDLLTGSPDVRARALRDLDQAVHHQNTVVDSTTPAVLYVTAILRDPQTDGVRLLGTAAGTGSPLRLLRSALLEWLRTVFEDVDDETERLSLSFGVSLRERPAFQRPRAVRPLVFRALAPLWVDPEPLVREAAIAAAVPLLDDPELAAHCSTHIWLARGAGGRA